MMTDLHYWVNNSFTGKVALLLNISSGHFFTPWCHLHKTLFISENSRRVVCCRYYWTWTRNIIMLKVIYIYAGTTFQCLHIDWNHRTKMSCRPTATEKDLINITSWWHTMYQYSRNHKQGHKARSSTKLRRT